MNATTITSLEESAAHKIDDDLKKITTKKPQVEKDIKLFHWSKERRIRFPIRPPRLKKVNDTEKSIQKPRIGYASALQTRQANANLTTTRTRQANTNLTTTRPEAKRINNQKSKVNDNDNDVKKGCREKGALTQLQLF